MILGCPRQVLLQIFHTYYKTFSKGLEAMLMFFQQRKLMNMCHSTLYVWLLVCLFLFDMYSVQYAIFYNK